MATEESPSAEQALATIANHLERLGVPFALVGGLAVSMRAEVRFTRDVDLVVHMADDSALESLVRDLKVVGYNPVMVVEHEARGRIATVRLRSRSGVIVDLLAASSGLEEEIIANASPVNVPMVGEIRVARAEDLLAMKVLSMTETRLQDRMDAVNLLLEAPIELAEVRKNLRLIRERGYAREEDLDAKLEQIVESARLKAAARE